MSFRNPGKGPKSEDLTSEVNKAHRLTSRGTFWGCTCGHIQSWTRSRQDAVVQQGIHCKAVVESIEDGRKGISHYGD